MPAYGFICSYGNLHLSRTCTAQETGPCFDGEVSVP
uniref:Uncharacterized protein n=1 Tax=Arundo donax TaxID=35708 RepID=A0A0A8YZF5_ARUDO